jgi:hypothetical protein
MKLDISIKANKGVVQVVEQIAKSTALQLMIWVVLLEIIDWLRS